VVARRDPGKAAALGDGHGQVSFRSVSSTRDTGGEIGICRPVDFWPRDGRGSVVGTKTLSAGMLRCRWGPQASRRGSRTRSQAKTTSRLGERPSGGGQTRLIFHAHGLGAFRPTLAASMPAYGPGDGEDAKLLRGEEPDSTRAVARAPPGAVLASVTGSGWIRSPAAPMGSANLVAERRRPRRRRRRLARSDPFSSPGSFTALRRPDGNDPHNTGVLLLAARYWGRPVPVRGCKAEKLH